MLDKFERLAHDGDFAVTILANPKTADFELIDLDLPLPDRQTEFKARGLYFVGIIGVINGAPQIALDDPLDAVTTGALAAAYTEHVETAVTARMEVELLTRLFKLDGPTH